MTVLGLDYSGGPPLPAAIAAAGYRFVVRYLANGLSGRADLTRDEATRLRAAGIQVALVWERKIIGQPDRVTLGRPAGIADAQAAEAQAQACGLAGWPIYFAIDFDIGDYAPAATSPRAKLGPAADYFDGVATVLAHNRIGVYGGYWAVHRALDAGLAAWAWQTVGWSGGNVDPRIHLFQRASQVYIGVVQCDVDEARAEQFGQNPPGDDMLDPNDPIVQQLQAGAASVQFGKEGVRTAGDLAVAVDAVRSDVDALKTAVAALAAPSAPQIDLDALAAKVASHIRLSGTVVADGQPAS